MKIKCIIILIAGLLGFNSCHDFLDKYPLDTVTEAVFWKSEKDVELFCNKFYSAIPDHRWNLYGGGTFTDGDSDNQYSNSDYLKGTRTKPATADNDKGIWGWHKIREINYFFDNYEQIPGGLDAVRHYVGEMYFFKAWYYFDLLKKYGDLPWYNKVLEVDSEELYAPRLPRSVIMDSICGCLDKAIAYLSEKGAAPQDRFSKDLAIAFKARVCLFEGTWEKYHEGSPFGVAGENGARFLKQAVAAAEMLMNKGYGLYYDADGANDPSLNYRNLFNRTDYSNNPEVFFFKKYNKDLGYTHNMEYQGIAEVNMTRDLVNSYLCKDGKPIYPNGSQNTYYKGDKTYQAIVENRDPRIRTLFLVPGEPRLIDYSTGQVTLEAFVNLKGDYVSATGFDRKKGLTLDINQYGAGACLVAAITMRYGEILLIYAEAKAELGELTQIDLDKSINLLRDRVGLPHLMLNVGFTDPNWDFPALSPILNEIRRERRIELALEGLRNYDICRWAAADELIVGKRPKGIWLNKETHPDVEVEKDVFIDANGYLDPLQKQLPSGYGFHVNRDYLDPIPTEELVLNPNLKQNPGWDN